MGRRLWRGRCWLIEAVEVTGAADFEILASESTAEAEIHVPPDLYTCDDCLAELTGPEERRFGYPFINCTQCGPRYTIITAMPYDRPNTSMADFRCAMTAGGIRVTRDRRFPCPAPGLPGMRAAAGVFRCRGRADGYR